MTTNESGSRQVEVVSAESGAIWVVHVIEDGETTEQSFEMESFAAAFAEGQRLRLGLDEISRS